MMLRTSRTSHYETYSFCSRFSAGSRISQGEVTFTLTDTACVELRAFHSNGFVSEQATRVCRVCGLTNARSALSSRAAMRCMIRMTASPADGSYQGHHHAHCHPHRLVCACIFSTTLFLMLSSSWTVSRPSFSSSWRLSLSTSTFLLVYEKT